MESNAGREIADALGVLLKRSTRAGLYRTLTVGMGEAVDELTYPVLSGLDRTGPRSAADLAREVGLDRSGVTRRATRLETAGLVRREPDPADRRATLLALTDEGERAVEILRQRLSDHITTSLASWPADEASAFACQLRRFVTEGPFA
ncbi:MarR family transcriptional regulator [Streptomyces aurantiacus]|uniref:Putative HTH-type transcriptional regulator YxaD n=1 Tax=Streptomyces aurantiacus JA 4570 TaxID=1286094 RepID=S3ZDZ5_9ACTN|nr:MarR family transcriptional regulator [Streptomyces aurantiacus]EPH41363.1 putative HTH-type transcriptional regulator YxaD [Streptomyces aurantiacus JA 4570]